MLGVYEKRIVSRFANAKWGHVRYAVLNAGDACVLVMVSNQTKHLHDLEEVIVDLRTFYQKKESIEMI